MADLIVVDDDEALCRMLEDFLSGLDHTVRFAGDAAALNRHLAQRAPDCVILDLGLPGGEDGFSIARRLRERDDLGIVMLTGSVDMVDLVVGLEIGADDYVTKPFSLRELAGRVETVLRRRSVRNARTLPFGPCTLDLGKWKLLGPDGRDLGFSATEIDLIAAFATHPNKVLSRDDVLRLAPAHGDDPLDRSVDTRVARLRRKLIEMGLDADLIRTARGSGYIHEAENR